MLNCTYKHMHAHCKVVQHSDTRPADEVISVYVYACVHMNLDGCPEEPVRSLEMESRWLWNQTPVLSKRSRAFNSGAIFQVLAFVCVSQVFWLVRSHAAMFQKYSFYLGLQIVGCPKTHYYIFILFFFSWEFVSQIHSSVWEPWAFPEIPQLCFPILTCSC